MAAIIVKTQYAGVRFREYPDRKFNGKPDRYFFVRYYHQGKLLEEGCGFVSEGWNAQKASILRAELVNNNRQGIRPMTLAEKRQMDTDARKAEEHAKVQAAEEQAEAEKANVTFGRLFEIYIENAKQTKKSWSDDVGRYKFNIEKFIGNRPAKDISVFELEKMKISLQKKGKSAKTVHHALSLVRTVYNKTKLWGHYGGENPAVKVSYPKIADNDRVRFLSFEEVKVLLKELLDIRHRDTHDLTLMAAFTGARYLEIASLSWSDVDLETGYVTFLNTKNGKTRTVPIPASVKEMLLNRKSKVYSPSDLVFPTNQGKIRLQVPNSFPAIADKLFNEGVEDRRQRVCFHTLRHSYISWLIMSGADLRTVQQISGHETMAMLKRYSHLTGAHLQKAADRVAQAFESDTKSNIVSLADRKSG